MRSPLKTVRRCRRPRSVLGLVLCATLGAAGAAGGWPVDQDRQLVVGQERFEPLSAIEWVVAEDPSIVDVEILPSGELFITPKAAGRTLLLLYAEGRFAVWRLEVSAKSGGTAAVGKSSVEAEALMQKAQQRCAMKPPSSDSAGVRVKVHIPDEACRLALLELFQTQPYTAPEVEASFDAAALQAQLKKIQQGLGPGLSAKYVGAGLVVEGKVPTLEQKQKVLWMIFRESVGRVAFEDRIQVETAAK